MLGKKEKKKKLIQGPCLISMATWRLLSYLAIHYERTSVDGERERERQGGERGGQCVAFSSLTAGKQRQREWMSERKTPLHTAALQARSLAQKIVYKCWDFLCFQVRFPPKWAVILKDTGIFGMFKFQKKPYKYCSKTKEGSWVWIVCLWLATLYIYIFHFYIDKVKQSEWKIICLHLLCYFILNINRKHSCLLEVTTQKWPCRNTDYANFKVLVVAGRVQLGGVVTGGVQGSDLPTQRSQYILQFWVLWEIIFWASSGWAWIYLESFCPCK